MPEKNKRADVINFLGEKTMYELADIYYGDNIDCVNEKTDDHNSCFYYDAPQNILNVFYDGYIE